MRGFVDKNVRFYEPIFQELVLKWMEKTHPSDDVIDSVLKVVDTEDSLWGRSSSTYRFNFLSYINSYRSRRIPFSRRVIICQHINISYMTPEDIREMLQRVNEIGYAVIGLPLISQPEWKCSNISESEICETVNYTLSLESGYYVIKNSTVEECHQQVYSGCDNSEHCLLKNLIKKVQDQVMFYWLHIETKRGDKSSYKGVSLILNRKEVIDEEIEVLASDDMYLRVGFGIV